jgi:hypothetical protein
MRMITGGILILALLATVGPAAAQVGIGLKAGLNFADLQDVESLDSIDRIENETKHGFVLGGHLAFPLSSALKLQIEGLYSVKGSTGEARDGLDVQKWENKLTYLDFPVLLKLELPTPALKPFLYAGGSVSVLLAAEERVRADWFDIKDSLSGTDYGLVVGGGLQLLNFTLEARYTHGLNDTVDDPDPHSLVSQSRNKVYSVLVGMELF